jgi:hypothetical protein
MDEKPYKFDPSNPRIVTNAQRPQSVYYVAGAIFLASLYGYHRRIFRLDQNVLNFAGFTVASAWASYQWSTFFVSSPIIEAGIKNNELENAHH